MIAICISVVIVAIIVCGIISYAMIKKQEELTYRSSCLNVLNIIENLTKSILNEEREINEYNKNLLPNKDGWKEDTKYFDVNKFRNTLETIESLFD